MSDESQSTSVQDSISGLGDQVENAVAGNSQDGNQQSNPPTQAIAAEAKSVLKNPNASKTEKKAAEKFLKKLTLKIDGQEYEEELPFEIPNDPKAIEYMRRELQMGRMGQKRAQEKASIEKEVLQFIEDLRKNPRKALSDPAIGMDLKKFAVEIMEEEIANSKKSPEQLEKEKLQLELSELKEQREREKNEGNQKELERLKEQEYERYDMLMSQALEKHNVPKNPAIIKRMADYMLIGLEAGKDVTPEDIIPLIREDLKNDYSEILASMSEDDLEDFIGKDVLNRLRKKSVAKVKQAGNNPALKSGSKVPNTGKVSEPKKEEKKISFKDFFKGV